MAKRNGTRPFQSPSGVLGVSRDHIDATVLGLTKGFQSPSGVLGVSRETAREGGLDELADRVSVPFRGFRGLQATSS